MRFLVHRTTRRRDDDQVRLARPALGSIHDSSNSETQDSRERVVPNKKRQIEMANRRRAKMGMKMSRISAAVVAL